jgi:hypothetical protein
MLALTLATRLLEARGETAGRAGLWGASKEGYATWLASAVDDRLVVAGPEGFERQCLECIATYEHNSGCGPNGSSPIVDVEAQLTILDWISHNPAGIAAAGAVLVERFAAELLPAAILIAGDTGLPGVHDGNHFTMAAETPFLDGFSQAPHRYDRWSAIDGTLPQERGRRLALAAHLLTFADPAAAMEAWVRVESAAATDDGTTISFSASVLGGIEPIEVGVFWAESPNREFNDLDQTPWQRLALEREGSSTTFVTSQPITPTAGYEVAWYVEALETVTLAGTPLGRKDATPLRLLRALPPLSCDSVPTIDCP